MTRIVCLAALLITVTVSSAAWAQGQRGADGELIITTPDQLRWSSVAGMPGVSEAWLVGHAGSPGFYVVRRNFNQGGQILPHTDAQTIFLTVLSGEVYVGSDDQIDPRSARRLPAGTFLIIPGGSPHYLWARYGDAVVQEWGTLPGKPADSSSSKNDLSRPRP
ncbi:MAG: cupin domain-containing protein [Alphaproteobacteria bacterium]|nr:cupin domain-containing protein [Alphaproteobacteria bacterium]